MPKYPENLIHFCRLVLEHYELDDEIPRMFVRITGYAYTLLNNRCTLLLHLKHRGRQNRKIMEFSAPYSRRSVGIQSTL